MERTSTSRRAALLGNTIRRLLRRKARIEILIYFGLTSVFFHVLSA